MTTTKKKPKRKPRLDVERLKQLERMESFVRHTRSLNSALEAALKAARENAATLRKRVEILEAAETELQSHRERLDKAERALAGKEGELSMLHEILGEVRAELKREKAMARPLAPTNDSDGSRRRLMTEMRAIEIRLGAVIGEEFLRLRMRCGIGEWGPVAEPAPTKETP